MNRTVHLSDVVEIKTGYPLRGAVVGCEHGGIPLVQMKDVSAQKEINWGNLVKIDVKISFSEF